MTHAQTKQRRHVIGFLTLVAVILISGAILWSQGDLTSPVESTTLVLNLSSGEAGFAMVGERGAPPAASAVSETTTSTEDAASTSGSLVETSTAAEVSAVSTIAMTMDEFSAALAAEGVDVEAVSATMSAGGRSLENLLAVVNSGRTTVAELAVRLQGEANNASSSETSETSTGTTSPERGEGGSSGLLDIRWDELGSVAYDLWFILAVTAAVIVLGRPVGWLINRLKRIPVSAKSA